MGRLHSAVDWLYGFIFNDATLTGGKDAYIQGVALVTSTSGVAAGTASNPLVTSTAAPIGGTYTDRSIANLAGTSETLMAANASRRVLVVYNIGATAIGVNLTGGTASLTAGGSVVLQAGGSLVLDTYPPASAITIIGTTNADVTAYEG